MSSQPISNARSRGKTPTILVGAAGTGTAFGACAAIRRHWGDGLKIVAIDINPAELVTSSLLANGFVQVPPFKDENFIDVLIEIVNRFSVDHYLPLFPQEIQIAVELKASSRLPHETRLIAPSQHACAVVCDKYLMAQWLIKNGLPTPRTALEKPDFEAAAYCIKPRVGTGSIGFRRVSAADMMTFCETRQWPSELPDGVIIQEACTSPEVTIDAYHSIETGTIRALCRERVEIKSGVATKVRIFEDAELSELAFRLATRLKLDGVFCFQVMKRQADWCIMDINPRPGAGTPMGVVTGNDFFAAMVAHAVGENTDRFFRPVPQPAYVTRQYADFLMSS